jgi:photosystem II stability/assembly factor-like uncharacterized protein
MMEQTLRQDCVYSMAAAPDFVHDRVCFVARESGLYRYDARTRSWHNAYEALHLPGPLVTPAVALSPSFATDHTLYAGTSGGVLRSEDAGTSWVLGATPQPPPVITTLALSPDFARDGVMFAGSMEDGVLRSPDRGSQWHRWNFGLLDLHILAMTVSPRFAEDATLLVGTDSGIFRSTNSGRSWRQVGFPSNLAPVLSIVVSDDYPKDDTIFVGTEASGLLLSRDDGGSWIRLGEHVLPDVVNIILASRPYDLLAATDDAVFTSRDGGNTWSDGGCRLPPDQAVSAVMAPQGLAPGAPLLVGTTDGQVIDLRVTC